MLDDLQLDQIADPHLREVIQRLMNLVEQLSTENRQLREVIQHFRDAVNRLKGEQVRPKIPARPPDPVDHSSEAERRVPRGRVKQAKHATIPIDREETRDVDRDLLPPDAACKGYEEVIVLQGAVVRAAPAAHLPRGSPHRLRWAVWPDAHGADRDLVLRQPDDGTQDRRVPAPSGHPDLRGADREPADQTAGGTTRREGRDCRGRARGVVQHQPLGVHIAPSALATTDRSPAWSCSPR